VAKIFVVERDYQADIKAVKVDRAEEADILVFVEKNGARALGDTRWFYVGGIFSCTAKVFWADRDYPGALKVFFVDEESEAKWTTEHPLRGQL
jgi:hypothetical protein